MGCCSGIKTPEGQGIYHNFNSILKHNNFNFSISNYGENFEKIIKLSGNNFKKLSKKQNVRIDFLLKIYSNIKNLKLNKLKEEDIQKILYYILLLTILLKHRIDEEKIENKYNDNDNQSKISKINLNNLKRDLLSHGYDIFNIEFKELQHTKLINYYLSKMFYFCFQEFDESNNYINIQNFIEKIQLILDSNCLTDEEKYIFVRDNVLTLGEFFHFYQNNIFPDNILNIILFLYSKVFHHYYNYFIKNFEIIKNSINKNIRNNILKSNNLKRNINDGIILPKSDETIIVLSTGVNNLYDNNVKEIIINSLYFFFRASIQDIYAGKKILDLFGDKLSSINNGNKFKDIILLLILNEFCEKNDDTLILCLLEYIVDLISNNNETNDYRIYYDIILNSYFLMYRSETLSKKYITLINQVYIKEMENNINNTIIDQLVQIYFKKEKIMNRVIKLFFYFVYNLSQYYKEKINIMNNNIINNENISNNLLSNLINIIKNKFINIDNINTLIKAENNTSTNSNTHISIQKWINHIKIEISSYDTIIQNYFSIKVLNEGNILNNEFYLYFHLFMLYFIDTREVIDYIRRKNIIFKLFRLITKYELFMLQCLTDNNNKDNKSHEQSQKMVAEYMDSLILCIFVYLKIIEFNPTGDYIQDCYMTYKSLESNIQYLLNMKEKNKENKEIKIYIYIIKIIYNVLFFIISQFIRLIKIPNSIINQHKDIVECISKYNEYIGKYFNSFNITNIISDNKLSDLKEIISQKKDISDFSLISYNNLMQILDIIYSKLFGKNTSLYIFFDNQILNQKYFDNNININDNDLLSQVSDKITEVNNNSDICFYINNNYNDNNNDESINKQRPKNEKEKIIYSNIHIPDENENIAPSEKSSFISFNDDEKGFRDIKI